MNSALARAKHVSSGSAKQKLRRMLFEVRHELSADFRAHAAGLIEQRVRELQCWQDADVVALYAPVRHEVDPLVLLGEAKRFAAPVIEKDRRILSFREIAQRGDLSPGAFEIPAPTESRAEVPLEDIDLFLVPGLGFDPAGHRLGYGGGYYDATLAQSRGVRVGIAYDCQLQPEVPHAHGDTAMHWVITESQTLRC